MKLAEQSLNDCRVQDILDLLLTPDRLTQENLADAESRLERALSYLEEYGKQREQTNEWVQENLQPSAEKSRLKEWSVLKETLSMDSQWLDAYKDFLKQVSEFVRYMRYYPHLYKVVNHNIVFSGADALQTYNYYKTEIEEYAERQKKLDAALAAKIQEFHSKNPPKAGGS